MSAHLRLVTANDEDVTVDVTAAKDHLAQQLDSLSVVTSYSHALLNTTINPVTAPPEAWYTTVSGNLNTAKQHAMTWISDIAPALGSTIPQSIINYNNDFTEATAAILQILGPPGKTLSQQEKNDVIALIEATLASVNEQKSSVDTIQRSVLDLANAFQADHTALASGQNSAAAAIGMAEQDRIGIEGKIGELQTKLAQARAKVTVSGIGLGLAIFVAVAAFALAAVTGGVGLAVVGAVGVVGVGVAATYTGIFSAEITQLMNEIAAQQNILAEKKRQVTALRGLLDTIGTLKTQNEAAKSALTSVQTMYSSLADKLDAVLRSLKAAKTSPHEAVQRMKMNSARAGWKDTAEWAARIQALASGTTVQPVMQHQTLRMAY